MPDARFPFRRLLMLQGPVGPFFRLGPPVLRAAIRARCHYLDINDDWESTEAMFEMSDEARRDSA